MKNQLKFHVAYQGSLDTFCGIYAVINAVGYAISDHKIFTYEEKCEFFKDLLQYLVDKKLINEVIDHGTSVKLEEKYLMLAKKHLKEKYNITLQWRKFSSIHKWQHMRPRNMLFLLKKWVRKKNSFIIRINTSKTGDHWTVFKKIKFSQSYLVDSYHYLKLQLTNLFWVPKCSDQVQKNKTYIMKEGIFLLLVTIPSS